MQMIRVCRRMFSTKMDRLVLQLSKQLQKDGVESSALQSKTIRNYIQLTEESYMQHLLHQHKTQMSAHNKIDPRLLLMVLPTLQKQQSVRQHLDMLYPYLPFLNTAQLTLFYQYLLAHKPSVLPKLPPAKSLKNCQSLLVILSQLYSKQMLIDWLKQVPLYDGNNVYMLSMGTFAIIAQINKTKHKQIIQRSLNRIRELFGAADNQARVGIILLALEAGLPFSQVLLLSSYSLQVNQIDGLKLSLLVIELDSYLKKNYAQIKAQNPSKLSKIDQQMQQVQVQGQTKPKQRIYRQQTPYIYDPTQSGHVKFKLQQWLLRFVRVLKKQDWKLVIKLHFIVRLFKVLKGRKLQKEWLNFSQKLNNYTSRHQQLVLLNSLNNDQLISILQVLQQHKIAKPVLIKHLLIPLSQRLQTAQASEMVRLSKCLVTYVRLCEDYLFHFRTILERRKFIFSLQEINQLNNNFRRVQSLFPKPLSY